MGVIIKKPWTRQPQLPTGIDYSNPIAKGLVGVFNANDLNFGGIPPSSNSATKSAGAAGRSLAYSGSAVTTFAANSKMMSALCSNLGMSFLSVIDVNSLSNYGHVFGNQVFATSYIPLELRIGASPTDSNINLVRANAGGYRDFNTGSNKISAGDKSVVLGCTFADDVVTTTPLVYVNGRQYTTTNINGAGSGSVLNDNNATTRIGRRIDDATQLDGAIYLIAVWGRCLSASEMLSLYVNPWQIFQPLKNVIYAPESSSGVTGTAAITNANDTASAAGAPTVNGSLVKTNANDTASASGAPTITGSIAKTNANDTSAASGSPIVSGSLAETNSNDTSTASGSPVISGSAAITNANDTATASGSPIVSGSSSNTNANDTANASGTSTVTGSLTKTNANDTATAEGAPTVTGSAAITNANDTCSASGNVGSSVTGTAAIVNANDTASASGSPIVSGSLVETNTNDTASASGSPSVTGSLAETNSNDTVSAAGSPVVSGSAAIVNANDTCSASGIVGGGTTGTAAIINANDICSAFGTASQTTDATQIYGSHKKRSDFKSIYSIQEKAKSASPSIDISISKVKDEKKTITIVTKPAPEKKTEPEKFVFKVSNTFALPPIKKVEGLYENKITISPAPEIQETIDDIINHVPSPVYFNDDEDALDALDAIMSLINQGAL